MTAKETATQKADRALAMSDQTQRDMADLRKMVQELHDALLEKPLGGGDALLPRLAKMLQDAEAGRIVGEKLIFYGKIFGAGTAIGGLFLAVTQFLQMPK